MVEIRSAALLGAYTSDEIFCSEPFQDGITMFNVWNYVYGTRKHAGLCEIKEALPASLFDTYYKFAVVRNPWDRLISIYYAPNRVAQDKVKPGSFEKEDFMRIVKGQRTFRDFVKTEIDGELTSELNAVARFENLEFDIRRIGFEIGLPPLNIVRTNAAARDHDYRQYYDREMREAVRDKFAEEIEFFGYAF